MAALVGGGGAGGEGGGEHGGAAGAEYPFGEEPGEGGRHEVFADADGAVAGVGGVVAGVTWLVGAPVVGDVSRMVVPLRRRWQMEQYRRDRNL